MLERHLREHPLAADLTHINILAELYMERGNHRAAVDLIQRAGTHMCGATRAAHRPPGEQTLSLTCLTGARIGCPCPQIAAAPQSLHFGLYMPLSVEWEPCWLLCHSVQDWLACCLDRQMLRGHTSVVFRCRVM